MNSIYLILCLAVRRSWTHSGMDKPIPPRGFIPESEFKNHINVVLVKKNWKPEMDGMPDFSGSENPDDIIDRYPGDTKAAQKIFDYYKTYDCCEKKLANAINLISEPCGHNPDLDSVMIVTTISGNAGDAMSSNIIFAMAMRNMIRKYNVFVFDMSQLDISMRYSVLNQFFGKKANYKGVSKAIAGFIKSAQLIKVDGINLVGFCYSAHLIGHIARTIRKETDKKIKSLLALDPHSHGLSRLRYKGPSPDDAQVVHTYHTNSIYAGTFRRGSTVDVIFNGGNFQPGCSLDIHRFRLIAWMGCSHMRAFEIVWYLIIYPKLFVASKYNSGFFFKSHQKQKTEDTLILTFPPSGDARGVFHIKTSGQDPFGLGEDGAGD